MSAEDGHLGLVLSSTQMALWPGGRGGEEQSLFGPNLSQHGKPALLGGRGDQGLDLLCPCPRGSLDREADV